jgi:uncharacterized protein YvpB
MKLTVPYYSQFVDINDPFWMLRACGVISLKMVCEFHEKSLPDIITLCDEAKEKGGYDMTNGWVHDYLVSKAKEFGLQAYRKEKITDIQELTNFLDAGNPVIVSVEKRVLEQKRFHMVVLVGYEGDELYYHEPESTDKNRGQYRVCNRETFMNYWRGMAIFISK